MDFFEKISNTFYKQHFYKQPQGEIGKKSSNENET